MQSIPTPQAVRNRTNAMSSTGPRTDGGKAIARRNATQHGLTANPAAGVVENPERFRRLHEEVEAALVPRNIIEASLCHRVAVSIWRLQRAAAADGAISGTAVRDTPLVQEAAQEWLDDLRDHWRAEVRQVTDKGVLRRLRKEGRLEPGEPKWEEVRPEIRSLGDFRERAMRSGAGITALLMLLQELVQMLEQEPQWFRQVACEQLSWLLGDDPYSFPTDARVFQCPDEHPHASPTQRLIGIARKREPGTPIPHALTATIDAQVLALRAQRRTADGSYSPEEDRRRRLAAMVPEERVLDRLSRYEVHAERSLIRCLETLAKLRGATVETLSASLRGVSPDGTAVEIRGERTSWKPGAAVAGEE